MLICVYIIGRALFSVNSLAVESEMLSMQRNIKTKTSHLGFLIMFFLKLLAG